MNLRRGLLCLTAVALVGKIAFPAQEAPEAEHSPARFASVAPSERIENLDKFKDQLKRYYACTCKCGCYAKDLDLQADRAVAFLGRRVRLEAAQGAAREKPALVLDIDETTLSNYQQMVKAGFAYDSKAFEAWVETASAPAIPGTLRIYKAARQLGVSVFFLTGRAEAQRAATERNLRTQGFDGWQGLILRAPGQEASTALEYKSAARARIAAQGYKIVLNVGDQWSDLRGNPEAEYSVKYPDPFYFLP